MIVAVITLAKRRWCIAGICVDADGVRAELQRGGEERADLRRYDDHPPGGDVLEGAQVGVRVGGVPVREDDHRVRAVGAVARRLCASLVSGRPVEA